MEVILAKSAGFCFGVERAIKLVYEQIENNKDGRKIYTFGPIIHNDIVVKDLESKGVFVFEDEDHFEKTAGSILIIHYDAAREHSTIGIRIESDGLFFPCD